MARQCRALTHVAAPPATARQQLVQGESIRLDVRALESSCHVVPQNRQATRENCGESWRVAICKRNMQ